MRRLVFVTLAAIAGLGACSVGGNASEPSPVVSTGAVRPIETVRYTPELSADLYLPSTPTTKPAIVWVHGGGFNAGDRTQLRSLASALAERGYPGMAIQYRLSTGGPWFPATTLDDPDLAVAAGAAVQDASSAVAWLQSPEAERRGIAGDAGVVVAGYSAGAITAATLAGEVVPGVAGAVAIAGSVLDPTVLGPSTPPLLFVHGDVDDIVPIGLARSSCAAAEVQGTRCELHVLEGTGHSLYAADQDAVLDAIEAFLESL